MSALGPASTGASFAATTLIFLVTVRVPPSPSVSVRLAVRWRVDGLSDVLRNVRFFVRAVTVIGVAFALSVMTNDTVFVPPVKVPMSVPPNVTFAPLTPI